MWQIGGDAEKERMFVVIDETTHFWKVSLWEYDIK